MWPMNTNTHNYHEDFMNILVVMYIDWKRLLYEERTKVYA